MGDLGIRTAYCQSTLALVKNFTSFKIILVVKIFQQLIVRLIDATVISCITAFVRASSSCRDIHKLMHCWLADVFVVVWAQVQQRSEGEYDVRLCVEEAGLIVARQTAPATTCNIILTSPILRDHLIAASPGTLECSTVLVYLLGRSMCCRIFLCKSAFAYFVS